MQQGASIRGVVPVGNITRAYGHVQCRNRITLTDDGVIQIDRIRYRWTVTVRRIDHYRSVTTAGRIRPNDGQGRIDRDIGDRVFPVPQIGQEPDRYGRGEACQGEVDIIEILAGITDQAVHQDIDRGDMRKDHGSGITRACPVVGDNIVEGVHTGWCPGKADVGGWEDVDAGIVRIDPGSARRIRTDEVVEEVDAVRAIAQESNTISTGRHRLVDDQREWNLTDTSKDGCALDVIYRIDHG